MVLELEPGNGQHGHPDQPQDDGSETVTASAGTAAGHTLASLAQAAGELDPDQGLDCLQCTLPPRGWKSIEKDDFIKQPSLQAAFEHVSSVLHGKIFPLLIKNQSEDTLTIVRFVVNDKSDSKYWACPWCNFSRDGPSPMHAHFQRRHRDGLAQVSRVAYLRCCADKEGHVRAFLSGPNIGQYSNSRAAWDPPPVQPSAQELSSNKQPGSGSSMPRSSVPLGPQMKRTEAFDSPKETSKRRRVVGSAQGPAMTDHSQTHSPRVSTIDGRRTRSLAEILESAEANPDEVDGRSWSPEGFPDRSSEGFPARFPAQFPAQNPGDLPGQDAGQEPHGPCTDVHMGSHDPQMDTGQDPPVPLADGDMGSREPTSSDEQEPHDPRADGHMGSHGSELPAGQDPFSPPIVGHMGSHHLRLPSEMGPQRMSPPTPPSHSHPENQHEEVQTGEANLAGGPSKEAAASQTRSPPQEDEIPGQAARVSKSNWTAASVLGVGRHKPRGGRGAGRKPSLVRIPGLKGRGRALQSPPQPQAIGPSPHQQPTAISTHHQPTLQHGSDMQPAAIPHSVLPHRHAAWGHPPRHIYDDTAAPTSSQHRLHPASPHSPLQDQPGANPFGSPPAGTLRAQQPQSLSGPHPPGSPQATASKITSKTSSKRGPKAVPDGKGKPTNSTHTTFEPPSGPPYEPPSGSMGKNHVSPTVKGLSDNSGPVHSGPIHSAAPSYHGPPSNAAPLHAPHLHRAASFNSPHMHGAGPSNVPYMHGPMPPVNILHPGGMPRPSIPAAFFTAQAAVAAAAAAAAGAAAAGALPGTALPPHLHHRPFNPNQTLPGWPQQAFKQASASALTSIPPYGAAPPHVSPEYPFQMPHLPQSSGGPPSFPHMAPGPHPANHHSANVSMKQGPSGWAPPGGLHQQIPGTFPGGVPPASIMAPKGPMQLHHAPAMGPTPSSVPGMGPGFPPVPVGASAIPMGGLPRGPNPRNPPPPQTGSRAQTPHQQLPRHLPGPLQQQPPQQHQPPVSPAPAIACGSSMPQSATDLLALIQGVQSLPANQRPERILVDLKLGTLSVFPNG